MTFEDYKSMSESERMAAAASLAIAATLGREVLAGTEDRQGTVSIVAELSRHGRPWAGIDALRSSLSDMGLTIRSVREVGQGEVRRWETAEEMPARKSNP